MKVLLLASGGDAPGMNAFIAALYKKFGNNLYACRGGFKGLYDGDIHPISEFDPLAYKNQAGCCIKTSRFVDFKKPGIFEKAVENAKQFDYVIALGGNGTKRGVKNLTAAGVKAIFVPATIDNDVEGSDYSIGFISAVNAVIFCVSNIMPSMASHDRSCIFETMGRRSSKIAESAAKILNADYCINSSKDLNKQKIAKIIEDNYLKNKVSLIIMRENIYYADALAEELEELLPSCEIKSVVVGHLQRGFKPTQSELSIAKDFARATIKIVKSGVAPVALLMREGKVFADKI